MSEDMRLHYFALAIIPKKVLGITKIESTAEDGKPFYEFHIERKDCFQDEEYQAYRQGLIELAFAEKPHPEQLKLYLKRHSQKFDDADFAQLMSASDAELSDLLADIKDDWQQFIRENLC